MSLNQVRTRRLDHTLDTLWYAISAPQVTAVVLVLLALAVGLAAVFPQLPPGLDGAEADRWLTTAAGRFPGTGAFLRSTGAFDLLHSALTRALMAVLALNLALRVAAQFPFLLRLRRPRTIPRPPPHIVSRRATLPGPLETALGGLRRGLEPCYTIEIESDAERAQVFAQRRPAGALGPLGTYAGLLLLLIGLVVDDAIGWRATDIALAPGNTTTLNRPGGLQITLGDVAGTETASRSSVTLTLEGRSQDVHPAPARPARWGNLWLAQPAIGPALDVTALDNSQRALVLQSLGPDGEVGPTLNILFQRTQSEQGFAIPTRNLTFRAVSYVALPEQGITAPVFLVEAYRGEEAAPAAVALVEFEGSLMVDDITLALRRDRYVELEAAYLPGLLPMLIGGLLVLAGVAGTSYGGLARVWAHLAVDGEQVLAIIGATGPAAPQAEVERLLNAAGRPAISASEAPNAA